MNDQFLLKLRLRHLLAGGYGDGAMRLCNADVSSLGAHGKVSRAVEAHAARSDSSLEQGCGVGVRMLPVGSGVLPAQGFRLRFR